MRLNLPVTGREHPFLAGETLVSTTDLKGRITHCNAAFVALSGYTKEELLGQPHNLVRHPEMPAEAFRDLWATIAAGRPWSGMVKNRRKDGDPYWVLAHVTPIMGESGPVGYMSVRTEPTRAQVADAEALYATMRAESQAGAPRHVLRGGVLRRPGWRGVAARAAAHAGRLRPLLLALALVGAGLALGVAIAGGPAAVGAAGWATGAMLALGLGALAGWRQHRLATRPMRRLLGFVDRMAAGDLSQSLQRQHTGILGTLEASLHQLNVNMRSIVRDARAEAERVRQVADAIASGNRDLADRTNSQAASVQQTAASMEQIAHHLRRTSQASGTAAGLGETSAGVTQRSGEAVHAVTQTMQQIHDASQRIAQIVQVIDSITFQTNLLALNAAVEAARAGEQGRGFAVVASEVRMLAQRSSDAAGEIKRLADESSNQVEAGIRQVSQARASMDEAVDSTHRVSRLITDIDSATAEQRDGVAQVSSAVSMIDTLTQQNASMVGELASLATSLEQQSRNLSDGMQVFRLERPARAAA